MLSEKLIKETNEKIDHALSYGQQAGIDWLRGAFHTHTNQIESLKEKLNELRTLYLVRLENRLSVREAQLLRVCRICRKKDHPINADTGSFILNFGDEFAHQKCLEKEKA